MQKLEADPVDGIAEMVPTYATLMIHYKPEKILYGQLVEEVKRGWMQAGKKKKKFHRS